METKPTTRKGRPPLPVDHQALVDQRKAARKPGRKAVTVRDAINVVQYKAITQAQPAVIARIIEGSLDKTDPLHEKCVDIMSKRVMPLAFWESLSKEEFRPDEEKNVTPVINITINGNAGIVPGVGAPAVGFATPGTLLDDNVVSEQ
jgi:hypothetical protein